MELIKRETVKATLNLTESQNLAEISFLVDIACSGFGTSIMFWEVTRAFYELLICGMNQSAHLLIAELCNLIN